MRIHLVGIGGTGMTALAGLLMALGHEVRGSDGPIYPPMSEQLKAMQVPVFVGYCADNLSWGPELVVVGNTCRKDNAEVVAAEDSKLKLTSFPALLADTLLVDRDPIVVAGTHGKTTTSSMLSHILVECGRDPGVFVGGVPRNSRRGWRLGTGKEFVLEGDEYGSAYFDKRSKFLHYRPQDAILTSVELDHVDIFSSMDELRATFREFVSLVPEDGHLLVAQGSEEAVLLAKDASADVEYYSGADGATCAWVGKQLKVNKAGRSHFEVWHYGELYGEFEMILTGQHNLENAVACIAICHHRGLGAEEIRKGLGSFSGVTRRQQLRGLAQGVTVIEDYGHHPTAIGMTLNALHKRYPGRRLVAVYEPRTATSRRKTFQSEYVDTFVLADELVVGGLFKPDKIPEEERFDPKRLALEVHQRGTKATCIPNVDEIVSHIVDSVRPGDVVAIFTTGAFDNIFTKLLKSLGDAIVPASTDHVGPIRSLLEELDLEFQDIDDDKVKDFYALETEKGVTGCVALEVFGEEGVLRSLGVAVEGRGIGYGWMLADLVIHQARFRGVHRLYLMTEVASDFFAKKHGFHIVDLSTVPEVVASSASFAGAKEGLVPMRLDLNLRS